MMDKHSYLLERSWKLEAVRNWLDKAYDEIVKDEDADLYDKIEAITLEINERLRKIDKEVRELESADTRMDSDLHSRSA